MVQDHYGMVGLLTFIRGAETDPNLVALALGRYYTTHTHTHTLNCIIPLVVHYVFLFFIIIAVI